MTMMLRLSLLLAFLFFPDAVTSNQDISKSLWRTPLQILRTIFSPDAILQAAIDLSASSKDGDETLNVSALGNDSNGDREETEHEIQDDDEFQEDTIDTPVDILSPEAAKFSMQLSSERSIVYNSVVDRAAKSMEKAAYHSRPRENMNDKFCTEDCSSRSHLPSNPEGHLLGSNDRW